jgi:hypothetical protein
MDEMLAGLTKKQRRREETLRGKRGALLSCSKPRQAGEMHVP